MSQHIQDSSQMRKLYRDLEEVVDDPQRWLTTPNEHLGGREPLDLLRAGDEQRQVVRDLIDSIKYGMFT